MIIVKGREREWQRGTEEDGGAEGARPLWKRQKGETGYRLPSRQRDILARVGEPSQEPHGRVVDWCQGKLEARLGQACRALLLESGDTGDVVCLGQMWKQGGEADLLRLGTGGLTVLCHT